MGESKVVLAYSPLRVDFYTGSVKFSSLRLVASREIIKILFLLLILFFLLVLILLLQGQADAVD
jgi:hypothetical protein